MEYEFPSETIIQGYIDAFQSLDGPRVASFYFAPCLSVRGDGSVHAFSENSEIETFFTNVLKVYSGEGMAGFTVADVAVAPVGSMSRRLDCTWFMRRNDNSIIREWKQTYIFRLVQSEWKIIASIFH